MTTIDEPVTVVASFDGKGIKPLSFRWGGRVIPVKEVTYRWVQQDGSRRLYFFSLTDGSTMYNLCFDTSGLSWRLQAVETEI